jgi:hypothetical protein
MLFILRERPGGLRHTNHYGAVCRTHSAALATDMSGRFRPYLSRRRRRFPIVGTADRYDRALRRSSNEGRRQFFGTTHRQIAFVCECPRAACYEIVLLTAAEYDARRPAAIEIDAHAEPAAREEKVSA